MTKQTINIGTVPNDGTGDTLRDAFDKTNDNFDEIYAGFSFTNTNVKVANSIFVGNSSSNIFANSSLLSFNTNNIIINTTSLSVGSNTKVQTNKIFIGNSTVNSVVTSSNIVTTELTLNSNVGLILGSSTLTSNGYSFLPNSLKMNWGTLNVNSSSGNVTYTSAYSTLLIVLASGNSVISTQQPAITSSNTTKAIIRTANTTDTLVTWFSLGI